jgi:hypothetical protein
MGVKALCGIRKGLEAKACSKQQDSVSSRMILA